MHPAVELALARMKTNPEDFINDGKWNQAIHDYKKWFNDEEMKAITAGLREMRMQKFQQRLFTLMTDEEEPPQPIGLDMYGRPIAGSTFGSAPLKISGQPVSYATSVATSRSSLVNDMEEEIRKQFELYKAEEKIKLEIQRELNNARL